jgi:hemerythrin-like metal-binding protein
MNFIEWSKDYELGIEQIDLQHKNLVAIINQLHDFISRGTAVSKDEIQDLLVSLTNYTIYHFDTEEDLMERYKYPSYPTHKKQHESFKETVVNALEQFDNDKINPNDIADFLKQWLLQHIAKEDTALSPFLKSQGIF